MPALDLAFFTGGRDSEWSRYRILGGFQEIRRAFCDNRVYPYLADLIHLRTALRTLADESDALRSRGPLTGIDLEEGALRYEDSQGAALPFEDLVVWAMPLIEAAIEEGRAIYDFVDERTAVEAVGIVPAYQDEGYLLVPDGEALRVLRYAVSLFTRHDERFRSLRTASVDEAPGDTPPHELKRFLTARHPDLPNPATYRVATDLDFPVDETMLPVAKRKLLQYFALGGPTGDC
jgi:hypothetical protein